MRRKIEVTGQFETIDQVVEQLASARYIADRALATVLFLAHRLEKPIFLEGEPGVGKTEVAIVMAQLFNTNLIRLQCYEGLDATTSLYEWNYPKQLLHIRLEEKGNRDRGEIERAIYSSKFLIRRPLLEAIMNAEEKAPVLLIDEVDRSDEEFEAFLLEVLSDFQITIPEMGTLKAENKPMVVVTSNRTRDVHDALKRRCLYHWIDYPSFDKEYRIIMTKLPDIETEFAKQITGFMQSIRNEDLLKKPGISESLDWARALMALHRRQLDESVVLETLGCILKYQEDIKRFREEIWSDADRHAGYISESGGRIGCR
ncbi:MAG: MoxR family ATPase [Deltaproteobacteria bacterium]|nr:MoxR family ATPase [Deltaproteobacteria bacterium]MBW1818398.1 MoxR family ATPase [Deltaproteobacteria bacterium]